MYQIIFMILIQLSSCATTRPNDPENQNQPPTLDLKTSTNDIIDAAIDFGGETSKSARKIISKKKIWKDVEAQLVKRISDNIVSYSNSQLGNAMMLYVSGPVTPSSNLFRKMMESERPLARQLAWQMAAALPGKNMQKNIEREINRSLIEGEERELLVPQMASAVQANRMVTAYTLVRQGLMETGHEDFATAMTVLNPDKARSDFLEYLAICPPEELRQISVSSINVYSANIALAHLAKNTPTVGHPKLEVLFYYSISRNPTLNELASAVLDNLTSKDQRGMAIILSRMPTWTQVAYIENARRSMSPIKRVFLSELKKTSPQSEVADELGEIQY